jgi:ribosome-binding factor A
MLAVQRISGILWKRNLAATMFSQTPTLLVDTSRRRWMLTSRTCTSGRAENGQSSKVTTDPELSESEANELPCRTVYYGLDGVESFAMDPNSKLDESFDWETFEREAGIVDDDFDSGSPMFANLEDFPDDLDEFEASIDIVDGTVKASFGQDKTRKVNGAEFVTRQANAPRRRAGLNKQDKVPHIPISSASWAPNASSRKLGSKEKLPFPEGAGVYSKNVISVLPKHPKTIDKPGMQRRLAMLESEMERIVTEVMSRSADWTETGMEVDAVGLSKNMQDLTVFYSSVGVSFGCSVGQKALGNMLSDKEIRKRVKTAEVSVRRAIASGMDLKYAPNIHFQGAAEQSKTGAGQRADLDDIFDRIAKERV